MSISVMSRVWRTSKQTGGALLVMLAMADWADDDGGSIFPSIAMAAKKSRLSERQVQRILRELEAGGEIRKGGRHLPASGRADRATQEYIITSPNEVTSRHPVASNGVTFTTERGDICDRNGVTPMSPDPSVGDPPLDPSDNKYSQIDPFSGIKNRKKRVVVADTFEPFWTKYPRKENKPAAAKAWSKLNPLEQAGATARLLVLNQEGWGCEPQFIPHPASWLNGRRWEDSLNISALAQGSHIPTAKEREAAYRNGTSH